MLCRYIAFFSIVMICQFANNLTVAQSTNWGTPYDKFFEMDILKSTSSHGENGEEKRSVTIPNQTTIKQTRKDGKITTMALDISGHGAVLCAREIYVTVKTILDICADLEYPIALERLGTAIREIEKFYIKNSLVPISQEDIEADYERRNVKFRDQFPDGQNRVCKTKPFKEQLKFTEQVAQSVEKMSKGEFKIQIEKMLSVPRLPVMNPCF